MISNERPSPYGRNSYYTGRSSGLTRYSSKPEEPPLKITHFQTEKKVFTLALKENPSGRFLRITEESQGRRNSIIIPEAGLEELQKQLSEIVKASSAIPHAKPAPSPLD